MASNTIFPDRSNFKTPAAESPLKLNKLHDGVETCVGRGSLNEPMRSSTQPASQHEAQITTHTPADSTTARATRSSPHNEYSFNQQTRARKIDGPITSAPSRGICVTPSAGTGSFGTPLSTIVEQRSCASLDAGGQKSFHGNEGGRNAQRQASRSLDEAALREFRNIIANARGESSNLSSDPSNDPLDRSVVQGAHANYAKCFIRSPTPLGGCTWPGDRERQPTTSVGTTPMNDAKKSQKGIWRAVRDYFRITTPAAHGQTAFSRDSIDAVRSTRLGWRQSPNTFNHRGTHPFHADRGKSPRSQLGKEVDDRDRNGTLHSTKRPNSPMAICVRLDCDVPAARTILSHLPIKVDLMLI